MFNCICISRPRSVSSSFTTVYVYPRSEFALCSIIPPQGTIKQYISMATVDCPRTGQSDSIGRWLGAALTPEQNSNKVINKCETAQKSLSDKSCFHATPSSLREAEHSRHHSDKPAMADHDRFVSPDQPHVPLDNSLPLVLFYDLTLC